jgi:amidase
VSPPDIVLMDARALAESIRARRVSCVEVMTAYLDHIDRFNPLVNAIVSLQDRDSLLRQAAERDGELARGEYRGWMHGLPHAVKDLALTRGIRTTWGSPIFADFVPDADAIFVERLRRAGAILIGKTNTPEFGLGSHTYNPVFGTTLNPYDPARTAGGSSGGAAAALALRMLPVADGSDHAGSLRNPAAFNNLLGFRPTFGRVPTADGDVFQADLGVVGPMARTVGDLALLLSVQAGHDARAPLSTREDPAVFAGDLDRDLAGTRVAWLGDLGGHLPFEAGVLDLCRDGLRALEAVGCIVDEVRPDHPMEQVWQSWLTLRAFRVSYSLKDIVADPAMVARLKPEAQWEAARAAELGAADLIRASAGRTAWHGAVRALFARYQYLVLPSAQVFPFDAARDWPHEIGGRPMDTYHRWMEVTIAATMAGCPALNVPVGFSPEGLPMGMHLVAPPHHELACLQLARAYERATGWVERRPPRLLGGAPPA